MLAHNQFAHIEEPSNGPLQYIVISIAYQLLLTSTYTHTRGASWMLCKSLKTFIETIFLHSEANLKGLLVVTCSSLVNFQ